MLRNIIFSFDSSGGGEAAPTVRKGLPLGNLTSQLLVNIYMNEFDQHVKHTLKIRYFIKYADDFVFISQSKSELEIILKDVDMFLINNLKLVLHPNKCFIKSIYGGVNFLGWVHFQYHRVLRTITKRRVLKRVSEINLSSYLGLLKWGMCNILEAKVHEKIRNHPKAERLRNF